MFQGLKYIQGFCRLSYDSETCMKLISPRSYQMFYSKYKFRGQIHIGFSCLWTLYWLCPQHGSVLFTGMYLYVLSSGSDTFHFNKHELMFFVFLFFLPHTLPALTCYSTYEKQFLVLAVFCMHSTRQLLCYEHRQYAPICVRAYSRTTSVLHNVRITLCHPVE